MKLMAFIVIAVMTYAVSVFHFVHQYATTTNVEQKKECRIGLTLFAVTAFFSAVIIKTVMFSFQGILPLL